MRIFNTSYELEAEGRLRLNDVLMFPGYKDTYKYTVVRTHLHCYEYGNLAVFHALGITDTGDLKDLCKKYYGYTPGAGQFPTYSDDDYRSAYQISLHLFRECERKFVNYQEMFEKIKDSDIQESIQRIRELRLSIKPQ